jgi:hypothetical protein
MFLTIYYLSEDVRAHVEAFHRDVSVCCISFYRFKLKISWHFSRFKKGMNCFDFSRECASEENIANKRRATGNISTLGSLMGATRNISTIGLSSLHCSTTLDVLEILITSHEFHAYANSLYHIKKRPYTSRKSVSRSLFNESIFIFFKLCI